MMEERIQRGGSANRAFWNRFSARCCFKHRQAPRLSAARCIIAQPAPLRGASAPAAHGPTQGSRRAGSFQVPFIASIANTPYQHWNTTLRVLPTSSSRHPELFACASPSGRGRPGYGGFRRDKLGGSRVVQCCTAVKNKDPDRQQVPDSRGQRRVVIQVRLFPSGALAPRFPGLGSVAVGRPAPSLKSRVIDDAFGPPKSPWFLRRAKSPGETLLFGLENIRLARDFSRFPGTRARGSTASVSDAKRSCRPADAEGQLRVLSFLHQRVAASCLLMLRPESHSPIARPERPQASSHILAIASWISE